MHEDLCIEETKRAINSLKDWKSPESDGIPAELIKYGGEEIHKIIHEICNKVWKTEVLPNDWKKAIIIPLYKKDDKLNCNNYRGISLLNSAYKIFSKILLKHFEPIADKCIGEYQSGFCKGKSTIDQLTIVGQLIEKKYEFRQNIWQVFVDFRKA